MNRPTSPKLRFLNEKIPFPGTSGASLLGFAATTFGSAIKETTSAMTTKRPPTPRYGALTASLDAWDVDTLERMKCAPKSGATVVPIDPTPCISVSLDEAVSGRPSKVIYGFAATCSNTMPIAKINKAPRNNGYWCNKEAG